MVKFLFDKIRSSQKFLILEYKVGVFSARDKKTILFEETFFIVFFVWILSNLANNGNKFGRERFGSENEQFVASLLWNNGSLGFSF